jgi:hypothetical protein
MHRALISWHFARALATGRSLTLGIAAGGRQCGNLHVAVPSLRPTFDPHCILGAGVETPASGLPCSTAPYVAVLQAAAAQLNPLLLHSPWLVKLGEALRCLAIGPPKLCSGSS